MPSYQSPGLTLSLNCTAPRDTIVELQRDLRALGYLRGGIDGSFGPGTQAAVAALQYDLLHNDGSSKGGDGAAPVAIKSFNGAGGVAPVAAVTGVFDQSLAACLVALRGDTRIPTLPEAQDPAAENARAMAAVANSRSTVAPTPFILAIVKQESSGQHFQLPTHSSSDSFITVGLDRNNAASPQQITSRGFGLGQYTLFHHPPRAEEVADFMLDPVRNVERAQQELRDKFDHFVAGPSDTADDRLAEHPLISLRLCRYQPSDSRYMRDCANCARAVRTLTLGVGTPFFAGASGSYQTTQYYSTLPYLNVPDRAEFLCDWPYAVRRYNGSGVNSFHYQTRVLLNLAAQA
ncbi:peptidoglycan-binding domain-containing protein [Paucibacter sp. APW11]|uniref:Peptidoglycan-binding domain-containing protein n=1 Tax=Roseateles aquae TaxID=3077235 RepID=A0ABU3PBA5_9BURK|nr:peptidoglycan-binding domain-containing protein [Paucibacter sp. APW11]MDT8999577.1 peptidoglycan-binding domain-containing protein [Paucibacter sp. APW11]